MLKEKKNLILKSIKLFVLHFIVLSFLIGVEWFLIDYLFNLEKVLDVLSLTPIFNLFILLVSFVVSVKVIRNNDKVFFDRLYKKIFLIYILQVFILTGLYLLISRVLDLDIFLFGGLIILLYCLYYVLNFAYLVVFQSKFRKIVIYSLCIFFSVYFVILISTQIIYEKEYKKYQAKDNLIYYHQLDFTEILGERKLKDENSAEELIELVKISLKQDRIEGKEEKRVYINPTDEQLALLSKIVEKRYLDIADEYLSKEIQRTVPELIIPTSGLRYFYQGVLVLSEEKIEAGSKEEAKKLLDELLLLGNQLLETDSLLPYSIGRSMLEDTLGVLEENFSDEIDRESIESMKSELDKMHAGFRVFFNPAVHMGENRPDVIEDLIIFLKNYEVYEDVVKDDFDYEMINSFLANDFWLNNILSLNGTNQSEKFFLSMLEKIFTLNYGLNFAEKYIVYSQIKHFAQKPGHELLRYYFEMDSYDYVEEKLESEDKAFLIQKKIIYNL